MPEYIKNCHCESNRLISRLQILYLLRMGALYLTSLNSGSNANCYYVGNDSEAVLIDAGLSCRETEKRMKRLGLSMQTVKAVFVSHEHADHITGVPRLSKKFQLPVFITTTTLRNSFMPVEKHLMRSFQPSKPVVIGRLKITAFQKSHDASDPHSFMVSSNQVNVGVFTDIGFPCSKVIRYFQKCHAAFLEANYCPNMLENGHYPYYLKKRISSDKGHLSNEQALDLFKSYRPQQLDLLILSHLSKNNNRPELVADLFTREAGKTQIVVASRYQETPVFRIEVNGQNARASSVKPMERQLALF